MQNFLAVQIPLKQRNSKMKENNLPIQIGFFFLNPPTKCLFFQTSDTFYHGVHILYINFTKRGCGLFKIRVGRINQLNLCTFKWKRFRSIIRPMSQKKPAHSEQCVIRFIKLNAYTSFDS